MKSRLPASAAISGILTLLILWALAYFSFPKIEWVWAIFGAVNGMILTILALSYLDDSPSK